MQAPLTAQGFSTRAHGFTLIEMLVVIAIMSVLITVGAAGLGGLGGKGVTTGVAASELLFDEARTIAVSRGLRTRVLIAKALTNTPAENFKRILVVSEGVGANGKPTAATTTTPTTWDLSSRGTLLPDTTFYSGVFSRQNQKVAGPLPDFTPSDFKPAYAGSYFYYEFNAEGICTSGVTGSAYDAPSFIIGNGARPLGGAVPPKVTASARRDFGGFVIWRNGRTSIFRNPEQMGVGIKDIVSGTDF